MKNLLTISLILLLQLTAFAQEQSLRIGIEAGPNLVSLRGNDFIEDSYTSRISLMSGLLVQYNFSQFLSFRSGVYIEDKGSTLDIDFTDLNGNPIDGEGKLEYAYLTVPLLARITVGKNFRYFANFGPYVAFLTKASQNFNSKTASIPDNEVDITDTTEEIDYGISGGIGVEYPLTERILISFEARHNLGLQNISSAPIPDNGEINTNSTNFLLGISYSVGK